MDLIIVRHGNTFGPEDKVCWVGAANDLPLVASGLEQARRFGEYLKETGLAVKQVYCGPLQRTQKFAEVACATGDLTVKIAVDQRLNELDYGDWSGLSNEEVAAQFGSAEQDLWIKRSVFPREAHWGQKEEDVVKEVSAFAQELVTRFSSNDAVVAVSSNGRLRYFLKLIPGLFEEYVEAGKFSVKTGAYGHFRYQEGRFSLIAWNFRP